MAQKTFSKKNKKFKDDYKKVIDFFQRWDQDTKKYYAAYKES